MLREGRSDHPHAPVLRATATTYAVIIIAVLVLIYQLRALLLPFVVAGALAYVATPLVDHPRARTLLPRWALVAVVYLFMLMVLTVAGLLLLPPLVSEVHDTLTHLPQVTDRVVTGLVGKGQIDIMGRKTDAARLTEQALSQMRETFGTGDALSALAFGSFASISGIVLTVVLLLYFLASGPAMSDGLLSLVPPQQRALARLMWRRIDPVLIRYFGGVVIVVVYTTGAAFLGLRFGLRVPNALVLAILTGFLELIPMVGPVASALVAGLASLRMAIGIGPIIAYFVYVTALRFSIDQVVGPLVLGRAGRVSPVLIIFCFLVGGALFGIVGVVLAVPVALAVRIALATLYGDVLDGELTAVASPRETGG